MNSRDALIKEMRPEDVPRYCMDAVGIIGLEAFMKLSADLGGTSFYVPKFENVIARARDRLIIKEFDSGKNIKELALKYGLTEIWIRNIIAKDRQDKNQISLFEQQG